MTLSQQTAEAARSAGIPVPHTPCPLCHQGSVPLEPILLAVWGALHETEARTAAEVAARYGATPEATDHRLKRLGTLGLARISGRRPQPPGVRGGRRAAEWVRVELPMEGPTP